VSHTNAKVQVTIMATVLHMRGNVLVPQPKPIDTSCDKETGRGEGVQSQPQSATTTTIIMLEW
jgi:hypothetical protein